jgi:cell wall-associated NlpC family hydrolase
MPDLIKPTTAYPWPKIPVDFAKLSLAFNRLKALGFTYQLGAKIDPSKLPVTAKSVDCSGFVRFAIWQCSGIYIPDGSVNQHDWVKLNKFKVSDQASALLNDGVLRIAFLSPVDGGGTGHVVLILNGKTMESHGGKGVDSRAWDVEAHPWMAKCVIYVLGGLK